WRSNTYSWLIGYSSGLPLISPSLYAKVVRSNWRSFAAEIHRMDIAREEDA
ncbi:hypothetical protein GW17_00026101, partial [Ensete ventricosum]